MIIKHLKKTEYEKAIDLAWRVFLECEAKNYTEQGICKFQSMIKDPLYLAKLDMFGAYLEDGRTLVGILATREKRTCIALFFVEKEYQGQGIGKALFHFVMKKNRPESVTVHASLYAREIYKKLGFCEIDEEQNEDGIRYIPMKLQFDNSGSGKQIPKKGNKIFAEELPEAEKREHERYMREALKLAKKAATQGDVPIGCVIVHDGKIIARGYNRRNADHTTLAHAEILAIKKASRELCDWRLEDCTMYVTLEPCQMCAGAIVQARIPSVVIGCMNPKAGCAGSIINLLNIPAFNHQVYTIQGVLEEECSEILTDFFSKLRDNKI